MIIFIQDWWDEWMDRFTRNPEILSMEWTHPVDGMHARHIHNDGNSYHYFSNLFIDRRFQSDREKFVFSSHT